MLEIKCPKCGKEIDGETKKCLNCGFEIEREEGVEIPDELICKKCGAKLTEEQQFCPKCGTEKGFINNKKCENCGQILAPGEKFCSKCGTKSKVNLQSDLIDKTTKLKRNKDMVMAIVGIVLLIVVVFFGVKKILPNLTVSVNELLAKGDYEAAYKKAKGSEKEKVEYENLIAYISKDVADSLKDPSSFKLRNAWYDKDNQRIVLYVNGNNSYGASVGGYWYYTYDEDDHEYELYTSLSSLEEEKTYSWDDYSEKLEKILKNAARNIVKDIIYDDDLKLEEDSIDNINNLFKNDMLDDVQLIEVNKSLDSSDSNKM